MKKKQLFMLIIGLVLAVVIVAGGTFAYLTLSVEFSNNRYAYGTECFNIVYSGLNDDGTTDITGALVPSATPLGGLSGKLSIGLDPSCDVLATGDIYLTMNSDSDKSSILTQTVSHHCEDSTTLETMTEYKSQNSCTSAGNTWVTNGTALKYAVYKDDGTIPISVGYINRLDQIIGIYGKFALTHKMVNGSWKPVDYNIYIWLDGNISDNSYASISLGGSVSADIVQEPGDAYAVYSEDDNSLRFYRSDEPINVGDMYNGRIVTAVYAGFETADYYSSTHTPWEIYRTDIKTVVVEDVISPVSTAYWFYGFDNTSTIDVTKLDTSKVTNMYSMFNRAGYNATSLKLELSGWNTSKVTNMGHMFHDVGYNAITLSIGDISDWNVSNVTNMGHMFNDIGHTAAKESFNIGNIGNWDTSKVTDMSHMFGGAVSVASSFYIGDLSDWNVSNVTNMYGMFSYFGSQATSWSIGNLDNWDVSKVTDMGYMFNGVGYGVTGTISLGNLSNWDTSNVTNMNKMFSHYGYNASSVSFAGIDAWDTSKVTNMKEMFSWAGYRAKTWNVGDLSNWDTSSVTDMSNMFSSAGYNATYTLNLRGWNVSKVTSYANFNSSVESKVIAPAWVN